MDTVETGQRFLLPYKGARFPPKPSWFDDPGHKRCRWCRERVSGRRQKWHHKCLVEFQMIFWTDVPKRIVFERQKGFCNECGNLLARWCYLERKRITSEINSTIHFEFNWRSKAHLDHIVPLCDYEHDSRDPYAAWRIGNLQVLCVRCHRSKTAREARARAEGGEHGK